MGDIYVSTSLKKCCRKTLADLDEKKKAAKALTGLLAVGSLLTMFGDSPVDIAIGTLADEVGKGIANTVSKSRTTVDDVENLPARAKDIENTLRSTCAKICELHSMNHTGTEALFWKQMAKAFY